jgi:hypothetical protein
MERTIKSRVDGGTTPHEECPAAEHWAQPWWLHAPVGNGRDVSRASRDARREFAGIAAQIGLAAWMFGTAMTSSCATLDRWSGGTPVTPRESREIAGAQGSAPASAHRPARAVAAAGR